MEKVRVDNTGYSKLRELRVAGILDELSRTCFPYECRFLELDTKNWEKQIISFQPQMLFIESAWKGLDNKWYKKIYNVSDELIGVVNLCKCMGIPTVFWNKEDPVHFDTFISAAALFDYIYTTDADCIPKYKYLLGHDRVGLLPFAVNPRLYNPIEKYERKNGCCFAGSYYRKQRERCEDFEKIYNLLRKADMDITIYDRNTYPGNPDYMYPEKYKGAILGSLTLKNIDVAYKGYMWNLTMNTVKNFPTMMARRVFELLASNTLVISNRCDAIENFFGGLVVQYKNDDEDFLAKVNCLKNNNEYAEKFKLLGLRTVLKDHISRLRMEQIAREVLGWSFKGAPEIRVFSYVKNDNEQDNVLRNYKRQSFKCAGLTLIASSDIPDFSDEDDIVMLRNGDVKTADELGEADYYLFMSAKNYYGENYVLDMVLALEYSVCPVIGKGCYFYFDGENFVKENRNMAYKNTDMVKLDRCMFHKRLAKTVFLDSLDDGYISGVACTSIDPYNFCANFTADSCPKVDDIEINTGSFEWSEFRPYSEPFNYSIKRQISGTEIFKDLILQDRAEVMHFGGGYSGVYSKDNTGKTFTIEIPMKIDVKDYACENKVSLFWNGAKNGNSKIYAVFKDKNDVELIKTEISPNVLAKIEFPESSEYFCFRLALKGFAAILLGKISFGVQPKSEKYID